MSFLMKTIADAQPQGSIPNNNSIFSESTPAFSDFS